ncbi:nucleotidyltransferase domain-containing protein [uncultured Thiocystis sp.]|uniref:nucleotidyltransferase domain-containing protein n=1 Tax=uncultured Thiocystis sp. TaxID=1202134 RepID=UPI0025FF63F0|nr:nucleotidyltransferase domain-containing protein [uncultured Thiocystis sp.]
MRLTTLEQATIQDAVTAIDPQAEVYLFGSRVDDQARGGDIDLLVLSDRIDLMAKLDLLARLHQTLGEQKIDLMIEPDASRPLARIAVKTGVRL